MIPRNVFRSRWAALLWAGGILWTAYDIASAPPGAPDNAAGAATIANALG